jgi:hypothetical protein
MTINQLTELIRHIEEEHSFFNRKSGQRIVKSLTPFVNMRSAGVVTAIDMRRYGWWKYFDDHNDGKGTATSMFNTIMTFLDTSEEDDFED